MSRNQRRRRSIHFRLTVWYAVALAIGQILFALALWASMRRLLWEDIHQLLATQITNSAAFVNAELREPSVRLQEELTEFSAAFNAGAFLRVTDNNRVVIFDSNPRFPWPVNRTRMEWHHHPYVVLSDQRPVLGKPWLFEVSASSAQMEAILARLRILLFTLGPLIVAIASLGGRWLSRRAVKPVDEMTSAAQAISASNLSDRLPVPHTGDELQRLAETWNLMLSRLEEGLKRLTRFTADAAHELRTPLAIIRTTAELAARRDRSAEAYREALMQVVSESTRMTKLLDDLLLLARVDADVIEMPQQAFNLVPVVSEVCSQLAPLAGAKRLRVLFRPAADLYVYANEGAARRIIFALLDNAVKYSCDGGEVHIGLENSGTDILLGITDNGPGINQSEVTLIFGRFYRGGAQDNSPKEGFGLGLSLAAGLAERNHARIEVASQPGKGSTFNVRFRSAA